MMAAILLTLGSVPILMLWTPAAPTSPSGRALSVIVSFLCFVMATVWLVRWPTRWQSVVFTVVSNICIAVGCLVWAQPEAGLLGSTAFAALAGYVAFFHSSYYLTLVLATATATSVICAVRVADSAGTVLAVAQLLILAVGILAVPFSGQVLVHLLGDDALKSHTDPLTGLRNRRGFYRSARRLVETANGEPPLYLTVVMVDLDRFKHINDTLGHATGDRILVAVADRLKQSLDGDAVLARIGGEEFLVAQVSAGDQAVASAERARHAIAALPWNLTASVGVASVTLMAALDTATRSVVDHLVEAADAAMYAAKRLGGNRIHRAGESMRDDYAQPAVSSADEPAR